MAGNAELADDKDVEGSVERLRHLERHRQTAPRQREDEHIGSIGVVLQQAG